MSSVTRIRMAQYGVGHGHAAGKALAMRSNPEVELTGIYEPDARLQAAAQQHRAYEGLRWYRSVEELLDDAPAALAIEGRNDQSLPMAIEAARAGKHLWYDKPAGDDWPLYQELIAIVRRQGLYLQMGYMFRYQESFRTLAEWVRSGLLGELFQLRGHMSTWIAESGGPQSRAAIAKHLGGQLYDLGGHMLDQVLWLMGDERPGRITSFLRNDATPSHPEFADNTLGVFEFARAMAMVDIAAMEVRPAQRRFEVYGSRGTAILDPMEPCPSIRLVLAEPAAGFAAGQQQVPVEPTSRQRSYERELEAFVRVLRGEQPPDRPLEHEILVQETLLRATGRIAPA